MENINKTSEDKGIIEHIEELRKTLINCFISIAIVLPVSFYFSPKLLDFLIHSFVKNKELYYFAPMEVFIIQLKLAFLLSLAICFPYIAKQLWDYLVPALYDNERKFIKITVLSSSLLFILGVIFCMFVILPLIMNFALEFSQNNIIAMFGVANVVNLAINLSFVFGLMFQIPLITTLLIKWGILSYETVSSKRRYIIVLLLIFSALLTPPDIISQILLFFPTYCLFELGLVFSKKYKENIE